MSWNFNDDSQVKLFQEMAEIAKTISVDEFVNKLERLGNGAKIHTINKSIFYLREFSENEEQRFKYGPKYDRLNDLKIHIYDMIENGNWNDLELHIRSWW